MRLFRLSLFACLIAFLSFSCGCIQIGVSGSSGSGSGGGSSLPSSTVEYPFPAEDLTGILKAMINQDLDGIPKSLGETQSKTAVCGFGTSIITASPEHIQMEVVNSPLSEAFKLVAIDQPTVSIFNDGDSLQNLSVEILSTLDSGKGVYWIGPEGEYGSVSLGVLLPQELVGPKTRLDVYSKQTTGGTPFMPDVIPLARGYLDMLAIGDSVMWGNGLQESDKFRNIIADEIESRTAYRVRQQAYAISGSTIGEHPDNGYCEEPCVGEVPVAWVTLYNQLGWVEQTEDIDLVLISGCINDITLGVLFDPDTTPEFIEEETEHYCHDEMLSLLRTIHSDMPEAVIAVNGYFQFVSEDSRIADLDNWAEILGIEIEPTEGAQDALDRMVENSVLFDSHSREQLELAIQELNQEFGEEVVVFVDPGFGPENAVFASEPYLWGFTTNPSLGQILDGWDPEIFPEDTLADYRFEECLNPLAAPDFFWCIYQAVGHPNVEGARVYSEKYLDALERIGLLPEVIVKE